MSAISPEAEPAIETLLEMLAERRAPVSPSTVSSPCEVRRHSVHEPRSSLHSAEVTSVSKRMWSRSPKRSVHVRK